MHKREITETERDTAVHNCLKTLAVPYNSKFVSLRS